MKAHKLLTLVVGFAACCSATLAYADPQGQYGSNYSPPPQKVEPPPITPPAGPKTAWVADPFFTVDFIYWTARQEGLAYAIEGVDFNATGINTDRGPIHEPDFEFDPGFKVGTGVTMQHDNWDVYANYTWLHTTATDKVTDVNGFLPTLPNFLFIFFNVTNLPPPITGDLIEGKTSWTLHFNTVDLELGRNYYISRFLTLRPHVGLKGTWQDQDSRTSYRLSDGNAISIHNHQDSYGVGIRAGLNTCWYFIKSFGLYGDFALTGLWNGFTNFRNDKRHTPNDAVQPFFETHQTTHSVKPVIELGIGLRYEYLFNQDNYRFLIQAGWEEQLWI
ncbi:MAG: MOMP family protein, partial [Chlamydiia bacterium]|nr:MOMP family protein [Chlamydiia bacterium]